MLSVIICGTNDNSGYNLHKRAALTLNCFAELVEAGDEIIFVDYNTTIDLPTLVEAIADTLTSRAAQSIRIVRIQSTDLSEAEAMREGLRAANASNAWLILARPGTVIRLGSGVDLCTALEALPPTPHRLSSLPIPEALWGSLDRFNPDGALAAVADWADRAHLGPHATTGPPSYILPQAWVSNACATAPQPVNPPGARSPSLFAYQCDFHGQVEDDWAGFLDALATSEQTVSAARKVQAFRIGEASAERYIRGLEAVETERLNGFLEAAYIPEAYGRLSYHAHHVLPYLLDLLSCVPVDTRIGYVGARRDMFLTFVEAWGAMGGAEPLLVPDLAPWLEHARTVSRPVANWTEEAELFIFEIGAGENQTQETLTPEERGRIWTVDYSFRQTAERERERQASGADPRRAIVVNGIHNFFEPIVMSSLSVTLTPFSSRIRHGYFIDPAAAHRARATQAERDAAASISRRTGFFPAELAFLTRLTSQLEHGSGYSTRHAAGRVAAEIIALGEAGWLQHSAGLSRPRWNEMLARLNEARPSRRLSIRPPLINTPDAHWAGSRLARLEDWERSEWAKLARLLFPTRPHDNIFERDLWIWERVTLAENLQHRFKVGSGAKILLAGKLPEAFASALAALDYEIDIVDPWSLSQGRYEAVDWRADPSLENWMFRKPLGLAADRPADFQWDGAIICQNGLFVRGPDTVLPTLRAAVQRVKLGGHVGVSARVQLNADDKRTTPESFPARLLEQNGLAESLITYTGLDHQHGVDLRITRRTLDRQSEFEYPSGAPPSLVVGRTPHLETLAVLGMAKVAETSPEGWRSLAKAIRLPFSDNVPNL